MAAALLACWLYACFAHGAVPLGDGARLEVALAIVAIAGVARTGVRARAPVAAWGGVALLGGFAAWSAFSLLW
ncbi:MAG TPA: hypothetical protein VFT52_08110, partial [Luteimonas sp.]|nr:hypothetical protein [Luteimonas sp.]